MSKSAAEISKFNITNNNFHTTGHMWLGHIMLQFSQQVSKITFIKGLTCGIHISINTNRDWYKDTLLCAHPDTCKACSYTCTFLLI